MIILKIITLSLFLFIATCAVVKIDNSNRANYILVLLVLAVLTEVI